MAFPQHNPLKKKIVMSAIWLKILVAFDKRNQVIQARKVTIDVKVANLHSPVVDLKGLNEVLSQNSSGDRCCCHSNEHFN